MNSNKETIVVSDTNIFIDLISVDLIGLNVKKES